MKLHGVCPVSSAEGNLRFGTRGRGFDQPETMGDQERDDRREYETQTQGDTENPHGVDRLSRFARDPAADDIESDPAGHEDQAGLHGPEDPAEGSSHAAGTGVEGDGRRLEEL